ncbi:Ribonuclease E inhibitor RraB [Salmonella enterica subsp. enterica]|uniref:Regulator of ribonuclease activity B n=3 Tax=Enterobacteriaceae TaxID=543 RepID=A0A3S4HSP3_SALET|nr:Ribonuclease E inhibitor RraB [Salmonella enterica subsp. enterica]
MDDYSFATLFDKTFLDKVEATSAVCDNKSIGRTSMRNELWQTRNYWKSSVKKTRLIIEELLEDGSDPDALYTIEHHLSADDFETLEKAAVEAFKLGYEVTEPEELEVEEGDTVICCDILSECALNAELIDAQVEQLMNLAEKYDVEYDGWGTYFEDPNGEEGDDDDYVDEDDDGVRH